MTDFALYQIEYSYLDELDTIRRDEVVIYDRETKLGGLVDKYLDHEQYDRLNVILSDELNTTDEHVAFYLDRRDFTEKNLTIELQEAFEILVRDITLLEAV